MSFTVCEIFNAGKAVVFRYGLILIETYIFDFFTQPIVKRSKK